MKLHFAEGTSYSHYGIAGIRIEDSEVVEGVEEAESSDHTFILKRSSVRTVPTLCGRTLHAEDWPVGSMAMLPAGAEWGCFPNEPYSATIFRVRESLFITAALDIINYDNIDFRYSDVGHSSISKIAESVRNMAVAGLVEKYPIMTETMCLAMAAETIKKMAPDAGARIDDVKNGLSKARKKRVLDFIEANVGRLISLSDIAAVAGLSPFHFSRSFKQSVGMSPSRYMIHRRISKAKHMLAGGVPVAQVAYECAFASQSHLTTLFKREVGITPAEYQRCAS